MTVDGGAAGYVRIAAHLIAATFERRAGAAAMKPFPWKQAMQLRPWRAAAFARRFLAHDAARTGARRSGRSRPGFSANRYARDLA